MKTIIKHTVGLDKFAYTEVVNGKERVVPTKFALVRAKEGNAEIVDFDKSAAAKVKANELRA